jgi:hypothetical protein
MSLTTNELNEFIPEDAWPSTAVMLEGFGEPSLPATRELAGRILEVVYEDGVVVEYDFVSATEVTVTAAGSTVAGQRYRAVEARPGILYVDVVTGDGTKAADDSLVLSLEDGRVTWAHSHFVDRSGEVRTATRFVSGRVAGFGDVEPRPRTDALVGKRIFYRYSDVEAYEHIYLDAGTFVWHCVEGGEKGLADVDRAEAYELADDLYILYWTESVMAVESVLVVDLRQRRSIGRMFCWDAPSLDAVHIPFDSRFTVLNETRYPGGDRIGVGGDE